jgi:hypothetical protein
MKPLAYIFDIDGTLANKHPDRDIYEFDKVHMDLLHGNVVGLYKHLRRTLPGHVFIIVSGRGEECREVTEGWLRKHGIEYDSLYMRSLDDRREDTIVKEEIYNYHIMHQYDVQGVFDDRLRVCRMWHSLGLTVFRVGDPDADF